MRIAFDARVVQDHFPGIGRYAVHLLDALARAGPEHTFAAFYDPDAPRREDSLRPLRSRPNVELIPAPPLFAPRSQLAMRRLIRQARPDVVHCPYYVAPFLSPVPLVVTIHDLIPLDPSHRPPRGRDRWLYRWLNYLAVRRAAHVITVSQHAAAQIGARFRLPATRMSVIHEAPAPHFRPAPAEAVAALRSRLDLPGAYFLHVGINKPHKNQVALVEAFARLARSEPAHDAALVLAGPLDPRHPDPRHLAEAAGIGARVRVPGCVAERDLIALYSGACAFVFPSLAEGFGLPLLEAMACGAPVACSNRAPLAEIAGEGALTFDPVDPEAIAGAMRALLGDPALRAAQRDRSLARAAAFSWERAARETLDVYRRAAQDRARR